jgi:hypothetical protein
MKGPSGSRMRTVFPASEMKLFRISAQWYVFETKYSCSQAGMGKMLRSTV